MRNIVFNGKIFSDYFVDSKGDVYNKNKKKLKPWDDGRGYYVVDLGSTRAKIHMLSAETYLGTIPKGKVVHHKDGNKHNNAYKNLGFATVQENAAHAQTEIKGKEYLTRAKVDKIRAMLNTMGIKEVAEKVGLAYHIVRDIKNGKTYKVPQEEE